MKNMFMAIHRVANDEHMSPHVVFHSANSPYSTCFPGVFDQIDDRLSDLPTLFFVDRSVFSSWDRECEGVFLLLQLLSRTLRNSRDEYGCGKKKSCWFHENSFRRTSCAIPFVERAVVHQSSATERSAKLPGLPAKTLRLGKPGWQPRSTSAVSSMALPGQL